MDWSEGVVLPEGVDFSSGCGGLHPVVDDVFCEERGYVIHPPAGREWLCPACFEESFGELRSPMVGGIPMGGVFAARGSLTGSLGVQHFVS